MRFIAEESNADKEHNIKKYQIIKILKKGLFFNCFNFEKSKQCVKYG
jgi:hypothetical protein